MLIEPYRTVRDTGDLEEEYRALANNEADNGMVFSVFMNNPATAPVLGKDLGALIGRMDRYEGDIERFRLIFSDPSDRNQEHYLEGGNESFLYCLSSLLSHPKITLDRTQDFSGYTDLMLDVIGESNPKLAAEIRERRDYPEAYRFMDSVAPLFQRMAAGGDDGEGRKAEMELVAAMLEGEPEGYNFNLKISGENHEQMAGAIAWWLHQQSQLDYDKFGLFCIMVNPSVASESEKDKYHAVISFSLDINAMRRFDAVGMEILLDPFLEHMGGGCIKSAAYNEKTKGTLQKDGTVAHPVITRSGFVEQALLTIDPTVGDIARKAAMNLEESPIRHAEAPVISGLTQPTRRMEGMDAEKLLDALVDRKIETARSKGKG